MPCRARRTTVQHDHVTWLKDVLGRDDGLPPCAHASGDEVRRTQRTPLFSNTRCARSNLGARAGVWFRQGVGAGGRGELSTRAGAFCGGFWGHWGRAMRVAYPNGGQQDADSVGSLYGTRNVAVALHACPRPATVHQDTRPTRQHAQYKNRRPSPSTVCHQLGACVLGCNLPICAQVVQVPRCCKGSGAWDPGHQLGEGEHGG